MANTDAKARRARALELHLAGATYEAIATAVGYASRSSALRAVKGALDAIGAVPGAPEITDTELARLDAMLTGLWKKARQGDVQAVDRVLRIGERRALLLSTTKAKVGDPIDEIAQRRAARGAGPAASARHPGARSG